MSGLWVRLGFLSGVMGVAVEDFVRLWLWLWLWLCFWGEVELDMVVSRVTRELGVVGERPAWLSVALARTWTEVVAGASDARAVALEGLIPSA